MVAQKCERTGKHAVRRFHCTEEVRVSRDPRLGSAGRNGHANANPLLQHKPWGKSLRQCCTAMVDDWELTLREPRRKRAALEAPQRLARPLVKDFSQHITGTKRSEDYQHGGRSR